MKVATTPNLTRFDQLAATHGKKKLCPVGVALDKLSPVKRAEFQAGAAQPIYTNSVLIAWLAEEGHPHVSNSAVTSHRRHTCTCL